jgi:hypothetical protein
MSLCCVTINTSRGRSRGTVICGSEADGYEPFEWVLLGSSDPEIKISPTTATEDVVSACKQADQGIESCCSKPIVSLSVMFGMPPLLMGWLAALARQLQCLIVLFNASPHGLRPPRSLVIEHAHRPKWRWDWTMEQFTWWKFVGTRFDRTLTVTEMIGILNPRDIHDWNWMALTSNLEDCTGLPRGPCTNL